MSESNKSRITFFIVILTVIAVIHLIILAIIIPNKKTETDLEDNTKYKVESKKFDKVGTKKTPVASKESNKSKSNTTKEKLAKLDNTSKKSYKYKVSSKSPNFGKKLDFSKARHGNLSAKEVPNCSSVRSGIIVDMDTRKVIWEKNSNSKVRIASMSKMMTLLLAFEHMEQKEDLSLNSIISIDKSVVANVPRDGVIWLDNGEKFPFKDIITAAAVKSANDAAYVISKVVANNEKDFVRKMNQRAAELALTSTRFVNSHGLPNRRGVDTLGSAKDMVLLGERLFEYPVLMDIIKLPGATIREGKKKTVYRNTNTLMKSKNISGIDGLKTGYTRAAGFCITFSVLRNGRRFIGCVTGLPSAKDRNTFCANLIEWAYRYY